jgi:phage-related protein
MARGTDFGGVHSFRNLHLIQAKVDIEPAKPKTNFIDIPGAEGSKDFSESPAGRVVFKTRKVTWTFKLYPGDNWAAKYTQVSNAINGRACKITLDDDPDYYYQGRVSVDKYVADSILRTITVVATCQPYKLRQADTTVTNSLTTTAKTITLTSERMPVVPTITVSASTTLTWKGNTTTLAAGTHKVLDIELSEGSNSLQAKTTTGTGTITIKYQKGAL